MNEILSSVYGAVLPSAPYVIAAYALIWIALFVFVAIVVRGFKKSESDIALLEERVEELRAQGDVSERER